MEIDFIGDIVTGAILFIVSGISAYAFKFFKERKQMIAENEDAIEAIRDKMEALDRKVHGLRSQCNKDSARIRKAIVILSKRLDKKSKEYHPDIDTAFEEITKDILTDEY